MFRPEQIPDVLEVLGWYDSELPDNVHRAVLALSKGNIDALLGYVAAAVTDFRDVLLWASEPEPTPEERPRHRRASGPLCGKPRSGGAGTWKTGSAPRALSRSSGATGTYSARDGARAQKLTELRAVGVRRRGGHIVVVRAAG